MYTVRKNTIYMKVKSGISGNASNRFRRAIKTWQKLRLDFKFIFKIHTLIGCQEIFFLRGRWRVSIYLKLL